jgi:hypothetical protein
VSNAAAKANRPNLSRIKHGTAKLLKDEFRSDIVSRVKPVQVINSIAASLPNQSVKIDGVGNSKILKGTK